MIHCNPIKLVLLVTVALAPLAACGDDGMTDDDAFVFASDAPSAYDRVDRMGMPAVATAAITSKDAYNAADPTDDANGDFVAEITANVTALHTALDDDLTAAGLTPCAPADCVATTAPFVVPDTLQIDPAQPAGFPNGRRLGDQALDVTLALVLLDVATPGSCGTGTCSVTTFAAIPLNPDQGDKPFSESFPFLATPHAAQ